ncbi:MAG: pseudouridine synthase [Treponema sp.]|nr:pseudouridine synthase [Treponema sp.]
MERLDKVLAHQGFGTRKDVKKLLRSSVVTLNGTRVTDPGAHIDMLHDELCVDDEKLTLQQHLYLMMNKCAGVVCANKDGEHRTVFDLIFEQDEGLRGTYLGSELHTIGRLDIDTEGLLLLTTDGGLTHRLITPKTHIPKTYAVRLRDRVDESAKADYVRRFAEGLHIPREGNESEFDAEGAELAWLGTDGSCTADGDCASVVPLACDSSGKSCDCLLTIYEGKFHQVKRMFAAVGNEVVYLKRVSMGTLALDGAIPPGSFRELTALELELLFQ